MSICRQPWFWLLLAGVTLVTLKALDVTTISILPWWLVTMPLWGLPAMATILLTEACLCLGPRKTVQVIKMFRDDMRKHATEDVCK